MTAVEAFIGMGSNLGDGVSILGRAWKRLGEIEEIKCRGMSNPYKTEPVDMTSHHWFTNGVGRIETEFSPAALLKALLQIEALFGRTRDEKSPGYQDRALDLDLLYYGDVIMDSPQLTLPHPRIRDRLFVLVPFMELAPDYKDPLSGETVGFMEQQLKKRMEEKTFNHQEVILVKRQGNFQGNEQLKER